MDPFAVTIIALGILLIGLFSRRIETLPVTLPMLFTLFGLLTGPACLNLVPISFNEHFIHLLAKITLIMVLFTDATRVNMKYFIHHHIIPIRMLSFGLFFVVLFGAFFALTLFSFTVCEAFLLAALLAPTDAALGQSILDVKGVPLRIRQALNIESGLNDALALPVVLIFMACATKEVETISWLYWIRFFIIQITFGPLVGIAVGYLGGKMIMYANRKKWINQSFQDLSSIGLAFLAYGAAETLEGNGFGAAFFAGMTLSYCARDICPCILEFGEAEGQLLQMLIFTVFGAVMVPLCYTYLSLTTVVYALLSLTVIRMVPILISLIGVGIRWDTRLYLSWFGPRGIASILFTILISERSDLLVEDQLVGIVSLTVLINIIAHGVTAYPLANWYSNRLAESPPESKVEEMLFD